MTFKRNLALSIAAAFALTGAAFAKDKPQEKAQQDKSAAAPKGAPMIVLVPMVVASRPDFSNGCWARLYDGTNFKGNELALVGPVDMPNMRTAFGTDWSGEFDSIQVGPKARLTVYDNENYRERAANFKSGQKVADLDEKMGFFEDISSVKVGCTAGARTAQQEGSAAAAGGTSEKK